MWIFPLIDILTMAGHHQQHQPSSFYLMMVISLWPSMCFSILLPRTLCLGCWTLCTATSRTPCSLASSWVPLIMGQWGRLKNRKRVTWGPLFLLRHDPAVVVFLKSHSFSWASLLQLQQPILTFKTSSLSCVFMPRCGRGTILTNSFQFPLILPTTL